MKLPSTFNWNEQDAIYCSAETINEKLDECKQLSEKGLLTEVPFYTVKNMFRIYKTYCVSKNSYSVCLRIFNSPTSYVQYMFNSNRGTSVKEVPEVSGMEAYSYIEELFQSEYGYGKSLFTAFSGLKYKEMYLAIKQCVPKPIAMLNKYFAGKIIDGIYKADISSAYPAEGSKLLPTLHGAMKVPGRVEPNSDYPFAFYVNSHHMKIYREFSTMDWCYNRRHYTLYDEMFDDSVPPEEDLTILCKASEFSLSNVFEEVYEQKKRGNERAKMGMNAAIGMFQKNNNPKLSHLSAVIIARCVNRVLKMAKKLEEEKNSVILIATDSIIWLGKPFEEATDTKFLGSFTYEIHKGKFYGVSAKAYQTIDEAGNKKTVYSGMKNGKEKDAIEFGKIPSKVITKRYMISEDGHVQEINWAL